MNTVAKLGTALITGASSGIGAVYADRLARRGYDLVLVARNESRLNELAARLAGETGRTIQTVVADLQDGADLHRVEQLIRDDAALTLLVNNAGVGSAAPLLQANVDTMEAMIELNVTALTRLTYAAAPAFVARGAGTIVNISSGVAIAPEFLNGVYGATKAFVLALSQSLKHELSDKGVRIQAVLPGITRTEFWDVAGASVDAMPAEMVMKVDDMVDAALAGLDQGEFVTIPSLPTLDGWNAFEAARVALVPHLSLSKPGARYNVK
ncbi:SDR family NAD(P)-dependent oxidoreductase [Burkholderia cenocepacia]|uniref:SDR family NAD(P)-dependent oxidoreductase n=1 Tax=Burkholderia cenocepacia TaxID=95486 RepID=UPI0009E13018|nr:SDR family oxidoreductase [Burkholderia cenocepacia]ARF86780.1 putative short-chain dehydrogenase [Burkholderia cenocepacia]MCW3674612.1 SDR family oxidoreductase [Burkholderia cenocepacia]MDC6082486.1 SDR family oxidoreductase [Burkholderia cenocepacia]SPV02554.1 short-chain dehydrogenase/reductase SDR [Burkholderia cenocepacia]